MSEKIILSEEDRKELAELYKQAQTTPAILLFGKYDLAADAWGRVRSKMEEFGDKYDFDPGGIKGINQETGEVIT